MKIKIIKSPEELGSLGQEWNALLKDSANNVIYLTHEWIMAWWSSFGKGNT